MPAIALIFSADPPIALPIIANVMKRMQMVRADGLRANPSADQLERIYRYRMLMSNMQGYGKREMNTRDGDR